MILLVLLCINCNRYIYPCNVLSVDLWPAGLPVSGWLVSIYILSSGGGGGRDLPRVSCCVWEGAEKTEGATRGPR